MTIKGDHFLFLVSSYPASKLQKILLSPTVLTHCQANLDQLQTSRSIRTIQFAHSPRRHKGWTFLPTWRQVSSLSLSVFDFVSSSTQATHFPLHHSNPSSTPITDLEYPLLVHTQKRINTPSHHHHEHHRRSRSPGHSYPRHTTRSPTRTRHHQRHNPNSSRPY